MKKLILAFIISLISNVVFSQDLQGTRWIIQKNISIDGVIGANTQDEFSKRVGKIIEYYEDYIIYDGEKYLVEKISSEEWTCDDLYKETRGTQSKEIFFEDIGFKGNSLNIKKYQIHNYRYPGEFFGLIDSEHGVTQWNGVWYLLLKL